MKQSKYNKKQKKRKNLLYFIKFTFTFQRRTYIYLRNTEPHNQRLFKVIILRVRFVRHFPGEVNIHVLSRKLFDLRDKKKRLKDKIFMYNVMILMF